MTNEPTPAVARGETPFGAGALPGFEAEITGLDEFLSVLDMREADQADLAYRPPLRAAVFVAALLDRRGGKHGMDLVRRYVVAAFAWGEDVVRVERVSSHTWEMRMPAHLEGSPEKLSARQDELLDETRKKIERHLRGRSEASLDLPVLSGTLRHAVRHAGIPEESS